MEELTLRLAQPDDLDDILKISEGIYDGNDYLPLKFHQWLQRDNLPVLLGYSGDKLVGLQACFVVDDGLTFIRRAGRIRHEFRGQGLVRQLRECVRKYVRDHFPAVQRERFTTTFDNASSQGQRKLLECDVLSYQVEKKFLGQAELTTKDSVETEICSREYLSDVIFSGPVRTKLFPDNVMVVNWCPFEPLRSNIDHILQESDGMFVEKCADDALPRSLSFGTFSPRVKFVQWLAAVYTDDSVLFQAHLLRQLKRACEVVNEDFIFLSFHDKSFTPLVRKVMEEQQQLKVHEHYFKKTMKLYERDVSSS